MRRLTCLIMGHDWKFLFKKNSYVHELGTDIPYNIHMVYQCSKCLRLKKIRV